MLQAGSGFCFGSDSAAPGLFVFFLIPPHHINQHFPRHLCQPTHLGYQAKDLDLDRELTIYDVQIRIGIL